MKKLSVRSFSFALSFLLLGPVHYIPRTFWQDFLRRVRQPFLRKLAMAPGFYGTAAGLLMLLSYLASCLQLPFGHAAFEFCWGPVLAPMQPLLDIVMFPVWAPLLGGAPDWGDWVFAWLALAVLTTVWLSPIYLFPVTGVGVRRLRPQGAVL